MKTNVILAQKPRASAQSMGDKTIARVVGVNQHASINASLDDILIRVQGAVLNLTKGAFIAETYWPCISIEFLSGGDVVELRP